MTKYIKQHDERDCGAACLSMIAAHYGLIYPLSKYRELTKTDRNGTSIYGLVDAGKKIGLNAEALSGNTNDLLQGINQGTITFPFIAHIVNKDATLHFVVIFGIKNNRFIAGDPDRGKVIYTIDFFDKIWNGYIVTFAKGKNFQTGNFVKGSFRKFFTLLKGQYKILITVIILSLIISTIGIAGAFVFETIIDDFYISNESTVCEDNCEKEHEHITEEVTTETQNILEKVVNLVTHSAQNYSLFFIMLIALYILQAVIQFFRGFLMSVLSRNIDIKLMLSYYNHIIDLPISTLNTRNTGEYISRFSDASTIRTAISGATLTLLLDSIMVIACGIILFLENQKLFVISLIIIILYAIVVLCYRKPIKNINHDVMENNARVQSYLKESIDGIEMIKSHQAETIIKKKNSSKFGSLIKSVFKNNIVSASQDSICNLIQLLGTVIILWVGFEMVLSGSISIGSLITFYALLSYFTDPIKNLIELQPMMQTAIVAAERLNDILDISAEQQTSETKQRQEWETIEFSHIDFRYSNYELTLKDVSFKINKGEKIAIVGESGCGKTTLAKLLMRFYTPERGHILINDNDINHSTIFEVRNNISYVDQNTFIFSDTVKNNLLVGNPEATDDEIKLACKLSHVDDFIETLPLGYNTYLDENGHNLSGGQCQRLAIARALLREPKLLILDEATSNLDSITENGIKNTIFSLDNQLTCVIIAHRLNTIRNCDRIIVMDKGRIVEEGTHDELINMKGRYFDLYYNRQ